MSGPASGGVAGRSGTGFDHVPRRPALATLGLLVAVTVVAAVFAHVFRVTTLDAIHWFAEGPVTEAAESLNGLVLFAVVAATVAAAAVVGGVVDARFRGRVGVDAVAASARGEERTMSFRASLARAAGTWLMSVGAVSVGRESAIIETAGAAGAVTGRTTGGRGDALAAAGITAAFAAAYHAPIAAVVYVAEHLGVHRSRRAVSFALLGSAGGYGATLWWFEAEPIFPGTEGSRWAMIGWALCAVVPAAVVARAFRQLRVRLNGRAIADRFRVHRAVPIVGFSLLAGLAVAVFPLAAGNGAEAMRTAPVAATGSLALALVVGKLVGTTAALASGAPGGVMTPSMAIAAGAGLGTMIVLRDAGAGVAHPWDVMVACMAVGVTVGLRSPLVAVFLVPEMLGDYLLVPALALVVAAAVVVDRVVDVVLRRAGAMLPAIVYDEDG